MSENWRKREQERLNADAARINQSQPWLKVEPFSPNGQPIIDAEYEVVATMNKCGKCGSIYVISCPRCT